MGLGGVGWERGHGRSVFVYINQSTTNVGILILIRLYVVSSCFSVRLAAECVYM